MVVLSDVTIHRISCGFALTGSIRTWQSRPLGGANPSVAPVEKDILQHICFISVIDSFTAFKIPLFGCFKVAPNCKKFYL